MVSFFGLKVGGKKKKPSKSPEPEVNKWKKVNQNDFGEGQFFGKNVHGKGVINGSIREAVSRPGTSASNRPGVGGFRSPYAHDTHNFAASSMYDLSNVTLEKTPSLANLKASHSDANLRTAFGNSSSVSLAAPTLAKPSPGFSSRPATANGKAKPWVNPLDVHFMRKDSTAPPAAKSPLGHFEIPPTPKSQDGDGISLFGDKTTDNVVDDLLASIEQKEKDEREAALRQAMEARKKEAERVEKLKLENERLEREKAMEAQRQKAAQFAPPNPVFHGLPEPRSASPGPRQANGPLPPPGYRGNLDGRAPSPGPRANGPSPQPIFRGDVDQRPSSAGGMVRNGPGPVFRGNMGERSRSPGPGQGPGPVFRGNMGERPRSPGPGHGAAGQGPFRGNMGERPRSPGPAFRGNNGERSRSPGPGQGPGPVFRGNMGERPRSPGPGHGPGPVFRGNMGERPRSPGPGGPAPMPREGPKRPQGPPQHGAPRRGPSPMEGAGPYPHARPGFPPNGPRPSGPITGGPPSPGLSGLPPSPGMSKFPPPSGPPPAGRPPNSPGQTGFPPPGPVPASPTTSAPQESFGSTPLPPPRSRARPGNEDAKPVIQNVRAKRETLVVNDSRRLSLSMRIEALEKTLVQAQNSAHNSRDPSPMRPEPLNLTRLRSGSTSSHYSEEDDDDEPISPIAISPPPTQLRPSPPLGSAPGYTAREQSPPRQGAPRIGQGIHRPRPSEYGVMVPRVPQQAAPEPRSNNRGPTLGGENASGSLDRSNSFGPAPHSRAHTPQNYAPRRPEHYTPVHSPEPPVATRSKPDTSVASAGFMFDFPQSDAPPTPDSLTTSWPLSETSAHSGDTSDPSSRSALRAASPTSPEGSGSRGGIQRSNAPTPLTFDFSPSAPSRGPNGPYTPPIRSVPQTLPNVDGRPQTAGNAGASMLRISPPTIPFPRYEDESPVLEPGATGLGIGMARGPSVKVKNDGHPDRRPNHGLTSPTGIADQFGTRFV